MSTSDRPRLYALDVLRGIAATAVVVHHTLRCTPGLNGSGFWEQEHPWWLSFAMLGDLAVTLFLVRSGASLSIGH